MVVVLALGPVYAQHKRISISVSAEARVISCAMCICVRARGWGQCLRVSYSVMAST